VRKLFSFFFTSLDGYHEGPDQDMSWHQVDDEFDEWDLAQLEEAGLLLLGRVTYEGFAEFWPTPDALEADPVRAKRLNTMPKVVVSRTLREAAWENTTIAGPDTEAEVRKLKEQPGRDIAIIGSARLTASLLDAGLVDEVRVLLNPTVTGRGAPAFPVSRQVSLELLRSRQFHNGNMLLVYRPGPAGTDHSETAEPS
jgi:dihydrofolate reductase